LAKNESDLLEYSLRDKLSWCDFVYIYDNGSTDSTWEIAQECAAKEPERILLFRSDRKPFRDGLRGDVFNHFREKASPGDWWCRADVDEFYAVEPRQFLTAVPARHHVVWSMHIQYLFTELDLAHYETTGRCLIPDDLPRHYIANYSEPRFFRHRRGLIWRESDAWPLHMGLSAVRRIPVRHYQFRSPEQIERRLSTRREAAANGYAHFSHSQATDWREKIDPSAELHFDKRDGNFVIDESAMPRHMETGLKRMTKLFAHGLGIWP
jgi:hypothetical protein